MDCENLAPSAPRWIHWWAVITLIAALPLLVLGAEVTTMGAGMVDARGLRSPWYFFQEFVNQRGLDWKIEHAHRQAGWIIGNLVIVLAVLMWWKEPQRWVRWLSVLALVAVCVQGLLGIFRIELNAALGKGLALVHGCFAQVVFALLATLAVVTSRRWRSALALREDMPLPEREGHEKNLQRWALVTAVLVYSQLILGGLVRHMDFTLGARAHVLGSYVVVLAVIWLVKVALDSRRRSLAWRPLMVLVFLTGFQVVLGIETWLNRFYLPQAYWNQVQPLALHEDFVRSLHYVVGTMLFATTVVLTLAAHQQSRPGDRMVPGRQLEGAA